MTRLLQIAIGLVPLLASLGCYNTSSVENGGLACSSDDKCPDGFACQSGRCWKGSTGGAPGTCTAPVGPVAGCSIAVPAGSVCDPVCQSGCGCHRCVLSSDASGFVCESTAAPASFVAPLGTCKDASTCAPGSVCIADDVCPNLCYKTCRTDSDCPESSHCTKTGLTDATGSTLVEGVYLCSPPAEACSPLGSAACAAARGGFNCVFLAGLTGVATTDATVCDCATLHYVKVGEDCASSPDNCQPGSMCVNGKCRTLCSQSSSCANGAKCTAVYNSRQYGYCP